MAECTAWGGRAVFVRRQQEVAAAVCAVAILVSSLFMLQYAKWHRYGDVHMFT